MYIYIFFQFQIPCTNLKVITDKRSNAYWMVCTFLQSRCDQRRLGPVKKIFIYAAYTYIRQTTPMTGHSRVWRILSYYTYYNFICWLGIGWVLFSEGTIQMLRTILIWQMLRIQLRQLLRILWIMARQVLDRIARTVPLYNQKKYIEMEPWYLWCKTLL